MKRRTPFLSNQLKPINNIKSVYNKHKNNTRYKQRYNHRGERAKRKMIITIRSSNNNNLKRRRHRSQIMINTSKNYMTTINKNKGDNKGHKPAVTLGGDKDK